MISWRRLAGGLAVLLASPAFAQAPPPPPSAPAAAGELAGLWTASRRFGPDARGPLLLARTADGWTADFMGRTFAVQAEGAEVRFSLPNGEGSFRGRVEPGGGRLVGHWIATGTPIGSGLSATPVVLVADGPDRLRGRIEPEESRFTFHLSATAGAGDTLGVVLNNPERDFGTWLGVDRMVREGGLVKLLGRRPGQAERVVARGTYDPESAVLTLVFPSRGGSYDFRRDGEHSGFHARGRNPGRYAYRPPPALEDGWPTGTLDQANIDRAGIERLVQLLLDAPMEKADTPRVHALLVARRGRLVLEEYFHGEHRDKLHDTRSASKSVTSVLVGAAIEDGARVALSTPVYQAMNGGTFPADLEPRKRAMTLEHLLTMSSGFHCDDTDEKAPGNEEVMQEQTAEPDFYRYMLQVPMADAPGEKAVYCSGVSNLALGVLGRATGESPLDAFDRLLGGPMKIRRYAWGLDPAGQPYGGGGVRFLARDFMKFGQLLLDGGTWQGRRILGREYVARATAPLYHLRGRLYGYQWWGLDYPYKDRTVHAVYAGGAGGQAVIAIPELDLVIATFGGNYSSSAGTFFVQNHLVPRDLLPAVREEGDDRNAPVVPRTDDYVPKRHPATATGPVTPR